MATKAGPWITFAAAAFLLADAVLIWVGAQADFAFDFTCCYQQAAARLVSDPTTLYEWSDTYTFRYTPLGAIPFLPLVPLDPMAAAWAWLTTKFVLLIGIAWWFSSAWTGRARLLVAAMVVAFPPVVHDLVIGNVSILTLGALVALARWRDARAGVLFGVLLVLMPKPHLLPVLAYLLVRRPRQGLAAMATAALGVVVGVAGLGIEPWLAFVGTLREPLERTFTANVGFSGLLGPIGVVVGVAVAVIVFVVGVRQGGDRGFALSIIAGILAGPYAFVHYLAGTIVAAEPVLRSRPRWLTPFPWLLVAFPLIPIWLLALAGVVRAAPSPSEAEVAPQGEARG